jgi:uncharacterized protein YkwD
VPAQPRPFVEKISTSAGGAGAKALRAPSFHRELDRKGELLFRLHVRNAFSSMMRYGLWIVLALAAACSSASPEDDLAAPDDGGTGGTGAVGPGATGGTSTGARSGASGGKAGRSSAGAPASSPGGSTAAAAGAGAYTKAGTGGASDAPGNHTNPLSQELINQFVKAHNDARAGNLVPVPSPPLPPVTWDAALADSAYNYLSGCASSDGTLVAHNADRTKDYAALGGADYVGENIYASSATTVMPKDAVDSWMSEASKYTLGDVANAGHYTQVVWRSSVRIGCAIVNCPNVRFHTTVLCDYAPGGNINGQAPY